MTNRNKRLALIRVAKAKLGMSDEEYRTALSEAADVASAADLTDEGFDRLMAYFRSRGFVSDARRVLVTGAGASQAQADVIVALWREVSPDPAIRQLEAWMERHHAISALRSMSAAKARKIIGALKMWKARIAEKEELAR